MLTNCLAACAHLTITVSEIERDIGRKSSFFHTPLAFDAPVRGIPVGLAPSRLARKKLEWLGYQRMKKFRRYLYSFWHNSRTWQTDGQSDGQTDRHRMLAIAALMHSIARQKCGKNSNFWTWGLASIELCFHPCNILRDNRRGVSRGNKNVGCSTWKRRFFALAVWITEKLLQIDESGLLFSTFQKHLKTHLFQQTATA